MKMSPQPPDAPSGQAIEDKTLDKESIIELLGEDDQEQETLELDESGKKVKKDKPEEDRKEAKTGEAEEDKELTLEEELEDELKEPDEEKLELLEAPRRKDILAKYPNLYKDFPTLERSVYREQKYAEILPTVEDAKLAADKSQLLDTYEQELMNGSNESILNAVKDNDKEAFAKVVDNYLPNLYKVDQHAYYHTVGNIIKHTIISMVNDGRAQSNEELGSAAAVLNHYIFGTTQFSHPQKLSKDEVSNENREKVEEISQKEKAFLERQYNTVKDDLGSRVDNILKSSVDKAIDPNETMTDYVRKVATSKVLEGLEELVSKDTRFRAIYDKLWEKAFESDFDRESMDRIKSAYLSKAKTLLPILIRRERNEALKGLRRSDNTEKDRRGPLPVGKIRSSTTLASGSANRNAAKSIPKGMTSLEFLNSDD
jgi:hypothetical protein